MRYLSNTHSPNNLLTPLAAALGLCIFATAAQAQEAVPQIPELEGLQPGQYTLEVSTSPTDGEGEGPVSAQAEALPADEADARISEADVNAGNFEEQALYTYDDWAPGADNTQGPWVLKMLLGPQYTNLAEADSGAVMLEFHIMNNVRPGEHPVEAGFLDVGPNSQPVAVMLAAASRDRSQTYVYSWEPQGTLELLTWDRRKATGRFAFTAQDQEGEVVARVRGAFRDIPYTPGPALELEIQNAAGFKGQDFDEVWITQENGSRHLHIATHKSRGPRATVTLDNPPEAKTYQTETDQAVTMTWNEKPAEGQITFTQADHVYAGELSLEAPGRDEHPVTLRATFQHLRPE